MQLTGAVEGTQGHNRRNFKEAARFELIEYRRSSPETLLNRKVRRYPMLRQVVFPAKQVKVVIITKANVQPIKCSVPHVRVTSIALFVKLVQVRVPRRRRSTAKSQFKIVADVWTLIKVEAASESEILPSTEIARNPYDSPDLRNVSVITQA